MRLIENASFHRTFLNLFIVTAIMWYFQDATTAFLTPFIGGFFMGVLLLYFNSPKAEIKVIDIAIKDIEENNGDNQTNK